MSELTMSQAKTEQPYIGNYLARLAAGGVSLTVVGDRVIALPELSPVMADGKPVPMGTLRTIAEREQEILDYVALGGNEYPYPHLTPEEVELSELVLDALDDEELYRYEEHKKAYTARAIASDCQTTQGTEEAKPSVVRGGAKAKVVSRESLPAYHETPEDRRGRILAESLERLSRTSTLADESAWTFEASDLIKWAKRRKPNGEESLHFFKPDEFGVISCDCQRKQIRHDEPCTHEVARKQELSRRTARRADIEIAQSKQQAK